MGAMGGTRVVIAWLMVSWCATVATGWQLGLNIDPTNPAGNTTAAQTTTLGTKWVRIEYKDPTTGSPQAFGVYDSAVDVQHAAGVNVLMILDYQSLAGRPSASAPASSWDTFGQAFAARAAIVAKHYLGRVAAYEIWNEPDLTHVGDVPAAMYGPLLEKAYVAIKNVDKSITVVMGGLASGNPGYVADARAATGGVLYADGVGLHPYGQRPSPDWPTPTWGFGVLGDLMTNYIRTENKPIWITEVGTSDTSVQGQFPARIFAAVNSPSLSSITATVFWFCWSDGMVNPMGLVTAAGVHKESYTSYYDFAHGST